MIEEGAEIMTKLNLKCDLSEKENHCDNIFLSTSETYYIVLSDKMFKHTR